MNEELIECSCCGKMVPSEDVELAFRLPDVVAALSQDEQDVRCKSTDDICELDGTRFFVRCTIPIPVHERLYEYSIGAWAEIADADFKKIWALWKDENQADEPAIAGVLANDIPLSKRAFGCSVAVKLTGPNTRPHIIIADEGCSIFQEQKYGISLHRASEYSDITRKGIAPQNDGLFLVEEQELDSKKCSCCGKKIRTYCGHISREDSEETCADYWIRIPEGHDGYFTVAVSIAEGGKPRVVVLLGEATSAGLTYRIQDRKDSPWDDFGKYGEIMDRADVLSDESKPMLFNMVDKIADNDNRLIAHTKPYLNPVK
ncbi:MAG: DUF2199 domain-containing protein [Sideroxyarcus sp.]